MSSDLRRFHEAQGHGPGCAYEHALAELREGRKRGHWIWFILPQLRGLGRSPTGQRYGISDLAEAQAYLADPLLGQRLEAATTVITDQLHQPEQTLAVLMGSELDAAKTISSLTLFEAAGMESAALLLDRLGRRCRATQDRLRQQQSGRDRCRTSLCPLIKVAPEVQAPAKSGEFLPQPPLFRSSHKP